jgi:3-oxoacyl-[acyl-carrier protein] reductase
MRQQGWGRIINVASGPAIQPNPFMPRYNASKAALISLTKSLSKAYGEEGILVNAVSPAFVMTPLVESMLADKAGITSVSWTDSIYATATPSIVASS